MSPDPVEGGRRHCAALGGRDVAVVRNAPLHVWKGREAGLGIAGHQPSGPIPFGIAAATPANPRRTESISKSWCKSREFRQVECPAAADAAAEDLQAADLAAELAVQAVAVHGLVEVADGQRTDVGVHRAGVVGSSCGRERRRPAGLHPAAG